MRWNVRTLSIGLLLAGVLGSAQAQYSSSHVHPYTPPGCATPAPTIVMPSTPTPGAPAAAPGAIAPAPAAPAAAPVAAGGGGGGDSGALGSDIGMMIGATPF